MNRDFISNSNYVLRKIFNDAKNIDILRDFIEAILRVEISKITPRAYLSDKVRYLPQEEIRGITNVRIETKEGKELNVGIQIIDGGYIQEKILVYGATIHVNQEEYEEKSEVAKTITINILDLDYFSTPAPHKAIKLMGREPPTEIKEETEFHILELPKFKKSIIETKEDAWLAYLKGDNERLVKEAKEECKQINQLDQLLKDYWKQEIIQ